MKVVIASLGGLVLGLGMAVVSLVAGARLTPEQARIVGAVLGFLALPAGYRQLGAGPYPFGDEFWATILVFKKYIPLPTPAPTSDTGPITTFLPAFGGCAKATRHGRRPPGDLMADPIQVCGHAGDDAAERRQVARGNALFCLRGDAAGER